MVPSQILEYLGCDTEMCPSSDSGSGSTREIMFHKVVLLTPCVSEMFKY